MENYNITTLNDFPYAKGELSSLLHHIGTAAKMVKKIEEFLHLYR